MKRDSKHLVPLYAAWGTQFKPPLQDGPSVSEKRLLGGRRGMGEGKQALRLRREGRGHILNLKKILEKKYSCEPGLRFFFLFCLLLFHCPSPRIRSD